MSIEAEVEAARAVLRDKYMIWLNPIAIKAALEAAEAAGWQTMDTLPKDSPPVLVQAETGQVFLSHDPPNVAVRLKHWRPLPAPPLKPASGGEA